MVNKERFEGFLSFEDALQQDRDTMRQNFKEYINSGLATLLRLLDFDQEYVQAKGIYVYDAKGQEYMDFLMGYGSLNFGHNHPRFYEAIEKVKEAPNILQASIGKLHAACAKNLSLITPGRLQRSFFVNSGAEAVEAALKLARKATGKSGIIYTHNSYHGKTLGALSVTGRDKYQKPFQPLLPNTHPIPYGDISSLKKIMDQEIGAIILEPIQGEAGVILPPDGYLKEVQDICQAKEVLLILDEIQTGFGRTGMPFACEHEGVEPDIMVISKSLGGGVMPIGVCIATDAVWKKAYGSIDDCLLHTSTFGGNNLASAVAIISMELLLGGDLLSEVTSKGEYFRNGLLALQKDFPLIKEVRGRGLMIGVEFHEGKKGLLNSLSKGMVSRLSEEYLASLIAGELLKKHRIITAYTLNNPNVIRLQPPLMVTHQEIDRFLSALRDVLEHNPGLYSMAFSSAKTALRSFLKK